MIDFQVGIIGAGNVGRTLARLWHQCGCRIAAVYSRTASHANELAQQVEARAVSSAAEVVAQADVIFLTVSDDAIAQVAASLADSHTTWQGKSVVHCSGATELTALQPLIDRGTEAGCLHPAFPFSDVDAAMQNLPGATFAIEATTDELADRLRKLIHVISGQVLVIPPGQKAVYHAALCIASNYTVTLYAIAEALLKEMGAEDAAVSNALNTLLGATAGNLQTQGIPGALTGPLSRADTGTIQRHLDAIHEDHTLREVYAGLARLSYPMLQVRDVDIRTIEKLLQENNL